MVQLYMSLPEQQLAVQVVLRTLILCLDILALKGNSITAPCMRVSTYVLKIAGVRWMEGLGELWGQGITYMPLKHGVFFLYGRVFFLGPNMPVGWRRIENHRILVSRCK